MLKGIDVSSYQSSSVVAQNADQAQICLIKASQGTYYQNPAAAPQLAAAEAAGMEVGFYHYVSGEGVAAEVDYFLKTVGQLGSFKVVYCFDFEQQSNAAWDDYDYGKALALELKKRTGSYPLIYCSFSQLQRVKSAMPYCGLWGAGYPTYQDSWIVPAFLSQYEEAVKAAGATLTGWQFTGNGLDRSVWYLDRDAWQKIALGGGEVPRATESPTKVVTASPAVSTISKSWIDSRGQKWTEQIGRFTVGVDGINLRWGATLKSDIITVLHRGAVILYDAWSFDGTYTWLRQPRGNGEYGYCVCRYEGTPWGTFS